MCDGALESQHRMPGLCQEEPSPSWNSPDDYFSISLPRPCDPVVPPSTIERINIPRHLLGLDHVTCLGQQNVKQEVM